MLANSVDNQPAMLKVSFKTAIFLTLLCITTERNSIQIMQLESPMGLETNPTRQTCNSL